MSIAERSSSGKLEASHAHLVGRVEVVRRRARGAVAAHRVPDPDGNERFRGLYISDAEVDGLLAPDGAATSALVVDPGAAALLEHVELEADEAEARGSLVRLRRLASAFALSGLELDLLLVALAPDLDPRLERVYAYLHDDVSRRRATVGLALRLCGSPLAGHGRVAFAPGAPLLAGGLLTIEEPDRPFLTRALRVADRVTAHLLGDDSPDPSVAALLTPCAAACADGGGEVARALAAGCRLVYVREGTGGAGLSMAGRALAEVGVACIVVDLSRLPRDGDVAPLVRSLAREALLLGGGVVATPVEALAERGIDAVRALAECEAIVILIGAKAWDPQWARPVPFTAEAPGLDQAARIGIWSGLVGDALDATSVAELAAQFRLTPEQMERAATFGRVRAAAEGRPPGLEDLRAGSRAQNAAGLERLARRVAPSAGWDDIVVPASIVGQLREVVSRVRHRDQVLDGWGMGMRSSKGRGVKALFAGDSGTGKTLAAEIAAGELGLELYVVDLATVVDKYVGETEKNLDRIFAEADRVNGVLLFDEADALFGKRSEVKDAHDRYANVEVAYLLQRMESFDGLAILTTNLRANLDEAFARRIDAIVDFPLPEVDDRRRLWLLNLGAALPVADDIDVGFLADRFKLSGGSIRNIVLSAAFDAADAGGTVTMAGLVRATEREYRKLGHLVVEAEFGPYFAAGE